MKILLALALFSCSPLAAQLAIWWTLGGAVASAEEWEAVMSVTCPEGFTQIELGCTPFDAGLSVVLGADR